MAEFFVLTPTHRCNAQLAIAALRAGGVGILDLGYGIPAATRTQALGDLTAHARGASNWGLRWDVFGQGDRMPETLTGWLQGRVPILVLAGWEEQFGALTEALRQGRLVAQRTLLEVYSVAEALAAQQAGADGVILKGHEAGGRTGGDSAFLLLADAVGKLSIPYWLQGGLGLHSAAAAFLGGAAGIVLGEQLWLADEAPFERAERRVWEKLDGSETVFLGGDQAGFRCFSRANRTLVQDLDRQLAGGGNWKEVLRPHVFGNEVSAGALVPLGQEMAFAAPLARAFGTVGGILEGFRKAVADDLAQLRQQRSLRADGALAQAHRTAYPLVQGPMTRVSDVVPFCQAVAENGALPFLALALMRGPECLQLLREAKERLGTRSWGVGILGFVPPELRSEQMAAIREAAPPFALIAGGRPSQAVDLERQGIVTYLHVPSPGLLVNFLQDGSRHFIFEGRECGGHVGPRTSFTLWQSAVNVLLEANLPDPESVHVLFAGGIHDAASAALVEAIAAPLTRRGMKIGALMGTAYLFTTEAVQTGAITATFQEQMLACRQTTLLESGVGHASRCMATPFAEEFRQRKRELVQQGAPAEEIQLALEMLNLGRLRLASKGLQRSRPNSAADQGKGPLVAVSPEDQQRDGMYMIGQVVTRRGQALSMAELHEDVCGGSGRMLDKLLQRPLPWRQDIAEPSQGHDLAIVGMACLFPGAADVRRLWQNLVTGASPVQEVPLERWDPQHFFNSDRLAADQVYSRWGAFLEESVFDPVKYRIPPASLASIEPIQLLTLETAWQALEDAGYHRRSFPRERTAVIFGVCGPHDLGMAYAFRTMLRHYLPQAKSLSGADYVHLRDELEAMLPVWTEDSFPGFLNNVVAGRVSNALNLKGANFAVDAACASALAAMEVAVQQLRTGRCDVALVGAADATNNACGFMSFAKTQALSPRGRCSPFDAKADGIVLGEGVAVLVLKRLADAERDGDFIYSVIKGIGSSSDGRNRSLTAPDSAGQVETMGRAYADARVNPASVSMIEAHGTGTALGDRTELASMQKLLGDRGAPPQGCAVGSIKSLLGHTKGVAGLAGLIKTALALKHRILPPTFNVETPNEQLRVPNNPLYVNTAARPWCHDSTEQPRRAGVSAFGFGGTNFHVVLEEYTGGFHPGCGLNLQPRPVEIFCWSRATRTDLVQALQGLRQRLAEETEDLAQLAHIVWQEGLTSGSLAVRTQRLAIVASSMTDLRQKLDKALNELANRDAVDQPSGIYGQAGTPLTAEQVCFLFPGQGTQAVNMLSALLQAFPWGHTYLEEADALLREHFPQPLSRYLYPLPTLAAELEQAAQDALNDTRVAQPALGVMSIFALEVLRRFGIQPAFAAGHSYGEYVALHAAGVFSRENLLRLSAWRGQVIHDACKSAPGGMLAVTADLAATQAVLRELNLPLTLANVNAPDQTVVAGPVEALDAALPVFQKKNLTARKLRVSAPFHTPTLASAASAWPQYLDRVPLAAPRFAVFSNTTAGPFGFDAQDIRQLLTRHLAEPVLFDPEVRQLHQQGARLFVEVGPGSVLTSLVGRILKGKEHVAVSFAGAGRDDLTQLAHLLARCHAAGLSLQLAPWFEGRRLRFQTMDEYFQAARTSRQRKPTDWLVSGARARPVTAPAKKAPTHKTPTGPTNGAATPAPKSLPTPQPHSTISRNGSNTHMIESSTGPTPALALERAEILSAAASRVTPIDLSAPRSLPAVRQAQPTPPLDERAVPANGTETQGVVNAFQETMRQWLAVQERYLRTQEEFLGVHERMLTTALQRPAAARTLETPLPAPSVNGNGHAKSHELRVPPAPILPMLRPTESATPPAAPLAPLQQPPAPVPAPVMAKSTALTAPAPSPAATPEVGSLPTTEEYTKDLLNAVVDRTGYPLEVLDLDLAMEAGLGIDSIKRIEILNSLKKYYDVFLHVQRNEEEALASFARLKTLRDVIQAYDQERQKFLALNQAPPAAMPSRSAPALVVAATSVPASRSEVREVPFDLGVRKANAVHRAEPSVARAEPSSPLSPMNGEAEPISVLGLEGNGENDPPTVLRRFVLQAVEAPATLEPDWDKPVPANRCLLILGRLLGPDQMLEDLAQANQQPAYQIIPGSEARQVNPKRFTADFASPESLAEVRRLLPLEATPPGAILNLLALDSQFEEKGGLDAEAALTLSQWTFNFLKVFTPDLDQRHNDPPCRLFHFTSLGGKFGLGADRPLPLYQAGTLGVVKTFAREFPGVRVKLVDLDLKVDPSFLFFRVLGELAYEDDLLEVGLNETGRWKLELAEEEAASEPASQMGSEPVILITGGGYGITAQLAQAVAEAWQPKLILVGRTPLVEHEPDEVSGLKDESQLRHYFVARTRQAGMAVLPAEVEKSVRAVIRDRNIRATLQKLSRLCPVVEYHAMDARDGPALGGLIDQVYQTHGRIDGVIHGAGIIEDKSFADKGLDSFTRVFNTKVQGALHLANRLRPEGLKFFALVSSVAGRFGNAGQVDYSAANEYLNKLANHLNREWPGRIVALNFGPWDGGVVSPQLARLMTARHVGLIPLQTGAESFLDEIRMGAKSQSEVVIVADHPEQAHLAFQANGWHPVAVK